MRQLELETCGRSCDRLITVIAAYVNKHCGRSCGITYIYVDIKDIYCDIHDGITYIYCGRSCDRLIVDVAAYINKDCGRSCGISDIYVDIKDISADIHDGRHNIYIYIYCGINI